MQDLMTPNERRQAILNGKDYDRLPITFSHESFSAKLVGMNYRQGFNSAQNAAKKEIYLYQKYGIDGISVAYTSVNFAIRQRSQVRSPKDSPASVVAHRWNDLDHLEEIDITVNQFEKDIAQQVNFNALEIICEQIGDQISPTYAVSAPLTLASGIIPTDKILRAMRKQPEKVHQLLRITTEVIKAILKPTQIFPGISYFIYDPVASGSLLSPKQYESFCLPYVTDLVTYIKQELNQAWVGMHICGDTSKSLPLIAATGIDGFSLDQCVDLALARQLIGDQVTLLGNIDPVKVFLQGDVALMAQEVKRAYLAAGQSPKGFIIRSGCAVPYETDVKLVDAYVDYAKQAACLNK